MFDALCESLTDGRLRPAGGLPDKKGTGRNRPLWRQSYGARSDPLSPRRRKVGQGVNLQM